MRRRDFIAAIGSTTVVPLSAHAQQPASSRVARVGWLTAQRADSLTPFIEALRAGFVDLGYVEGRNLTWCSVTATTKSAECPNWRRS